MVKTFRIFNNPTTGEWDAVKKGFSWPALLFGFFWAFTRDLWWYGAALFVGHFAVVPLMASLFPLPLVPFLVLGYTVLIGFWGNEWCAQNLDTQRVPAG